MKGEDIAQAIADLLGGRTVATAESVTCGRIATALGCADKAERFLSGSVVAYQERTKREILGVTARDIVSAETAEQMAAGVARVLGADATVATTGLAGSRPQDGQPGGTVFVATYVDGDTRVYEHHFGGEPQEICDDATTHALDDLLAHLQGDG